MPTQHVKVLKYAFFLTAIATIFYACGETEEDFDDIYAGSGIGTNPPPAPPWYVHPGPPCRPEWAPECESSGSMTICGYTPQQGWHCIAPVVPSYCFGNAPPCTFPPQDPPPPREVCTYISACFASGSDVPLCERDPHVAGQCDAWYSLPSGMPCQGYDDRGRRRNGRIKHSMMVCGITGGGSTEGGGDTGGQN